MIPEALGRLLFYPYEPLLPKVRHCRALLQEKYPEQAEQLAAFEDYVQSVPDAQVEELYLQTFDIQAVCCLDVGYVQFGEDYKRGQFMAQLKELHRKYGVDLGSELPDFLPNVLILLSRIPKEEAALLVSIFIEPAVSSMVKSFEGSKNVYRAPLQVIQDFLERTYLPQKLPVIQPREEDICTM